MGKMGQYEHAFLCVVFSRAVGEMFSLGYAEEFTLTGIEYYDPTIMVGDRILDVIELNSGMLAVRVPPATKEDEFGELEQLTVEASEDVSSDVLDPKNITRCLEEVAPLLRVGGMVAPIYIKDI